MWGSRKDKNPSPQFYADVIAHLVRAYPHAAIDREVILGLKDFLINEWRNGQSGRDAAAATCSCDGKQIIPSAAAGIFLAKRSALPPKGAKRETPESPAPVFGAEDLREPPFLTRMRRELLDAEMSFARMSAELEHAAGSRKDELLVSRGDVARRIQELGLTIKEVLKTRGLLNPPPPPAPRQKKTKERLPKVPKAPRPPKPAKEPKPLKPPKPPKPAKEPKPPKATKPPKPDAAIPKRAEITAGGRAVGPEVQTAAQMLLSLVHDEKKAVLLGANPYGLPSIQDVVGAEHEGMGSFRVKLGERFLRFEGGGAMSHVGPLSYTILRGPVELAKFRDGTTGYPFGRVEETLRALATGESEGDGSAQKGRTGKRAKSHESEPKQGGRRGRAKTADVTPANPIDQSELVNLLAAELAGDQSTKGN